LLDVWRKRDFHIFGYDNIIGRGAVAWFLFFPAYFI